MGSNGAGSSSGGGEEHGDKYGEAGEISVSLSGLHLAEKKVKPYRFAIFVQIKDLA